MKKEITYFCYSPKCIGPGKTRPVKIEAVNKDGQCENCHHIAVSSLKSTPKKRFRNPSTKGNYLGL